MKGTPIPPTPPQPQLARKGKQQRGTEKNREGTEATKMGGGDVSPNDVPVGAFLRTKSQEKHDA